MMRSLPVTLLVLLTTACGASGKEDSTEGPPRNVTITIVDPVDGQLITDVDDEDDMDAGFQITITCAMTGWQAGEAMELTVHDDRYDVGWTYEATHDGSDTLTYPAVVLWPGDESMTGQYTLTARSTRWDVASEPVSVEVISAELDASAPGTWETDCSSCEDDSQCDDGLVCNGRETCAFSQYRGQFCCYTEELECPDADTCTVGICSEAAGGCTHAALDADGDGHPPVRCGYDDCDDTDYSVHPGAAERCDGLDNDCDGAIDEDAWVPVSDPLALAASGGDVHSPILEAGSSSWAIAWLGDPTAGACGLTVGAVTPSATGPAVSTISGCVDERPVSDVSLVALDEGFAVLFAVTDSTGSRLTVQMLDDGGSPTGSPATLLAFPATLTDLVAARASSGPLAALFRSDPGGDYELYMLTFTMPVTVPHAEGDVTRITDSEGFSGHPSLVGLEGGFGLAWEDDRDGDREIYFTTVDDHGISTLAPRRITTAPGASESASLASAPGGGFGLAWMDSRAGGYDMIFTCLDETGSRQCPELALEEGSARAWYPFLSPDAHAGQYAMVFASLTGASSELRMSAVTVAGAAPPEHLEPGQALAAEARAILDPQVADVAGYRGVLWIQEDASTGSSPMFQQLVCE